jgi:hypothetical protein
MTDPNYKALCAEILQKLDQYEDGQRVDWDAWRNNARAALAEKESIEDQIAKVDAAIEAGMERIRKIAATPARNLPQPVPVAPTDEEIMEVFWEHQNGLEELWADDWPAAARAVLARWGRPTPQPVVVSERLPGPEDCDEQGRCWWGEPQIGNSHDATWTLCTQKDAEEFCTWGTKGGWLPANALPTSRTS